MKRLILNKLRIISHMEKKSTEVSFSKGLNIIVGKNKTGKSSLIKTIFDCFGAATKMEQSWKDLVSAASIEFSYGEEKYCIIKRDTIRDLYAQKEENWQLLCSTKEYAEFNAALMKTLDLEIPCVPEKGYCEVVPPSVLFALQYIDQDAGWLGIAKSFQNASNTKNWKSIIANLASGFHTEEYFELKAEIDTLKKEKSEHIGRHEVSQLFLEKLENKARLISTQEKKEPGTAFQEAEELMQEADYNQKKIIELKARSREIEQGIYRLKRNREYYSRQLSELSKDVKYALSSERILVCPICGAKYDNSLLQHLNLSEDLSICESSILQIDNELIVAKAELKKVTDEFEKLSVRYSKIRERIQDASQSFSHEDYIKQKGREEVLHQAKEELIELSNKIELYEDQIKEKTKKQKALNSSKQKTAISENITIRCREIAERIQYPTARIQLTDFIQKVDETGSDLPKCIYMYYTGMYLYNLDRGESPFNFLVIDTPNQQGQDQFSIQNIMSTLDILSDERGQFIICTERETGYEEKATNVISLTETRSCLKETKYVEHSAFFQRMLEISLS